MTKKKKKESWKEKKRRAMLKHQRALEAERLRRAKKPKRRKRRSGSRVLWGGFLILMILIIGAYTAWQAVQPSNETGNSNGTGELPLLYMLTDVELTEFRGKVVVVDCFATWCQPCKAEIPHLSEISEEYDTVEVVVISIGSSGDSENALRQFKRDYDVDWPVARDTVGVFNKYSVTVIPTIVILDQNGESRYRNEGVTTASTLANKIDELLGS